MRLTLCTDADTEKQEAFSIENPFQHDRYRGPIQWIARILSIARKPCLFTHIQRGTKITNYTRLKPWISSLVDVGLLEIIEEKDRIYKKTRWKSKQRVYRTTERGLEFLCLYKELNDLIHVGKTDLHQNAEHKRTLKKFREYLCERAKDRYSGLEAFRTDEDVQIQVLVEGRRMVNLEDVRQASERKRTITVTLRHREYELLKKEAQTIKRSYPDLLRRMVRHYFGFKGPDAGGLKARKSVTPQS